jgi:2-polyprenyl-3-methyl-5-hydroxy-6-metoxy-1,4-benzoquinol methylase
MNRDQVAHRLRDNLARAGTGLAEERVRLWHDGEAILAEVLKLWPKPDDAFLAGVVPLLLGRQIDAAGMEYGLSLLRNGSRLQTVRTLAECEEAKIRALDTSWLPQLERLHPDGLRVWVRQGLRRLVKALLRPPARLGTFALLRLWQWSGNPLRDPMAELLAHARQTDALAPLLRLLLEQVPMMQNHGRNRQAPMESTQDQRWLEVANQLDQFRRAMATIMTSTTGPDADSLAVLKLTPKSAATQISACCVCGGALSFKWRKRVLHDRHEAEYHECLRCASLQVVNATWLEEAYRDEDQPLFWNPDKGRFLRNFSAYAYLCAYRDTNVLMDQPRVLDYGGGYGLLTQMLRDGGFDAWLADPYVARPYFCPERHVADLRTLPAASFDVATAFEVLEHLTDPRRVGEDLRRILAPGGVFVLSTAVYLPGVHTPDWPYLSTELGQHVTFWSRAALSHYAAQLGFCSVAYSPGSEGFTILFSMENAVELKAKLAKAAKLLQKPEFMGRITRCWEFTHAKHFSISPEPLVEPARLCSSGVACAS